MIKKIYVQDTEAIDGATQRTITDEGYLVVPGVLARTGVQVYRRSEIGLDGDGMIRLMRTPEEVTAADSLASFENKPVTLGHPKEKVVTAKTWRKLSVGEARDIQAVGDCMHGTLIVKDEAAIKAIQSGKSALSNGYTFELDLTAGDGFDGYQRKIRGNHVAIVDVARGGPNCRVADEQPEKETHMKTLVLDGKSVELSVEHAAVVEGHLAAQASANAAKLKQAQDEADARVAAAKDEAAKELAAFKAGLDGMVEDRRLAVADAETLTGKAPECKGVTTDNIRRAAIKAACDASDSVKSIVSATLGGAALDSASPEILRAAINTAKLQKALDAKDSDGKTIGRAMLGVGDGNDKDKETIVTSPANGGRDSYIDNMTGVKKRS